MNIIFNPVKFKADERLEAFTTEKVSKLFKLYDRITKCEVNLKVEKPESENNKIAEIVLHVPGTQLFIKKQADTFNEAILQSVEAMKPQIDKFKEKLKGS